MGTVPSPRTWVDLERPTYATFNAEFRDTWNFLLNPPMCKVRQTSSQQINNATWTYLNWDVEDVDTEGMHSSTSLVMRVTPKTPGWYAGFYGTTWKSNTTYDAVGRRLAKVCKNGTTGGFQRFDNWAAGTNSTNVIMKGIPFGLVWMNGTTDWLEVQVYQDSGGTYYTDVGSGTTDTEEQPEFYVRWVRGA